MPDLRHGRWQDVLTDVVCDACIFDGPFSEETHERYGNQGRIARSDPSAPQDPRYRRRPNYTPEIEYDFLTPEDVREFVESWSPRTRGWMVSITDETLAYYWRRAMKSAGRLVFPSLPFVDVGSRARLCGDGPSSWAYWVVVGRPKTQEMQRWGTLQGAYIRSEGDPRSPRMGGKPLGVMREIVRDYAIPRPKEDGSERLPSWPERPLVCDPFAGGGTTLRAAGLEGCEVVGAEKDRAAFLDALEYLGTPTRADKTGTLALFG